MEEGTDLEREFEPEPGKRRRLPLWAKILIGGMFLVSAVPCIGLVATLVLPNIVRKVFVANVTKAKVDIVWLSEAVTDYVIEDSGRYPETLEMLLVPDVHGHTYLDADTVPLDPWGHPYGFEPPAEGSPRFRVFSLGSDGQPGGEGEARDIDNILIKEGKI